eukprot:3274402-Pleurochrysis_carterae.AAC.1
MFGDSVKRRKPVPGPKLPQRHAREAEDGGGYADAYEGGASEARMARMDAMRDDGREAPGGGASPFGAKLRQ